MIAMSAGIAAQPDTGHMSIPSEPLSVPLVGQSDGWQDGPLGALWTRARPIGRLTQVDPFEGAHPSADSDIRLARDDRALYVLARFADPEPERIIAREMERGASIDGDDLFRIVIDPYGRGREGYLFEINPLGNRREALLEGDQIANFDWDGRWQAFAAIDEHGWWLAVQIPFSALAFDAANDHWGFNFERNQRRLQERSRWANPRRAQWVAAVSQTRPVAGFGNIAPGLGLELAPNLRLASDRGPQSRGVNLFEPGLDGSYRLSRNLRLTATLNTDFAEAEIDAREVNLDRFPLFFPERRQFFQQDASFFRFGGINYSPWPVFTRRIGLDPAGQPIPIRGGLRLTGREGPWTIGALGVSVESSDGIPARELGILRVARDLGARSTVGGIVTYGEPRGPGSNSMAGFDYAYIHGQSRLGIMEARLWGMQTRSDLFDATDEAFGWQLRLPNEPWSLYQYIGQVGAGFDPGLGFVSRRGIREYIHTATYRRNIDHPALRWVDFIINPYIVTDLDNRLETLTVDLPRVVFRSPAGDELSVRFTRREERLKQGFEVLPGLAVSADDYRWHQGMIVLNSSGARSLSARATVQHGGFYDGRRTDYSAGLTWRPLPGLLLSGQGEQRQLRLTDGSATVRLGTISSRVHLTPRLSLSTTGQYDNVSRQLGINARLRWIVGMDNNFYLVFNRLQQLNDDDNNLLAQTALAKVQWHFLF